MMESMEPLEEVPLKELGESELERLVRGWRRRHYVFDMFVCLYVRTGIPEHSVPSLQLTSSFLVALANFNRHITFI